MKFDIDGARKIGYSDAQIADYVSQGSKFDVGQARKAGYSDDDIIKHLTGPSAQPAGTPEELSSVGDVLAAYEKLGPGQRAAKAQLAVDRRKFNPVNDMGTAERTVAGYGQAMPNMLRGAGQRLREALTIPSAGADGVPSAADILKATIGRRTADALGLPNQADIDEAKRIDAPLLKTNAGAVGSFFGNVVPAAGTVAIPGAMTMRGSAAIGAGMGALEPTATGESAAKATVLGGALGAAGPLVARVTAGSFRGGKALAEPFTPLGPQKIAARLMQRFGITAEDLAGVNNNATVTGAKLTLAEQIKSPSGAAAAARLQDSMRASIPEVSPKFVAREIENNAARLGTLRELAGEDGARHFAESARRTTANELYSEAFSQRMNRAALSKEELVGLNNLLASPAIQDARQEAVKNFKNAGRTIKDPDGSIEGMHMMKLAMDDELTRLSSKFGNGASVMQKFIGVQNAKDRLVDFIQKMSPKYGEARAEFAAMSKPVNKFDTVAKIVEKGTSATSNIASDLRLMPDALARITKDEGRLINQATGRNAGPTLADLMEPDQLAKLRAVLTESDKAAAVARTGAGPGSATAQRIASGNVMHQALGSLGGAGAADSAILKTVLGRPLQFIYGGVAEPKIQQVLQDLVFNPRSAIEAMALLKQAPSKVPEHVRQALPIFELMVRASTPAAAISAQR